jgi:hypothetical protein
MILIATFTLFAIPNCFVNDSDPAATSCIPILEDEEDPESGYAPMCVACTGGHCPSEIQPANNKVTADVVDYRGT